MILKEVLFSQMMRSCKNIFETMLLRLKYVMMVSLAISLTVENT